MDRAVGSAADDLFEQRRHLVALFADAPLGMISPKLGHQETVWVLNVVDFVEPKGDEHFHVLVTRAIDNKSDRVVPRFDEAV